MRQNCYAISILFYTAQWFYSVLPNKLRVVRYLFLIVSYNNIDGEESKHEENKNFIFTKLRKTNWLSLLLASLLLLLLCLNP
jgi:hypothetical protein